MFSDFKIGTRLIAGFLGVASGGSRCGRQVPVRPLLIQEAP